MNDDLFDILNGRNFVTPIKTASQKIKVTVNVILGNGAMAVRSPVIDWPYQILPGKGDFIDYEIEELLGEFNYDNEESKAEWQSGEMYVYKDKFFKHINKEPVIEIWFELPPI